MLPQNPSRTPTALRSCAGTPEFFLEIASALMDKPVIKQEKRKVFDALGNTPCDEDIAEPRMGFRLIFNKFNVAKRHYLLIAEPFRHQLELLNADAFSLIYEMLREYPTFTVVYNGGRNSGSSQPRQHIQILQLQAATPLDLLVEQTPIGSPLEPFKDVVHFVQRFKGDFDEIQNGFEQFSSQVLHNTYLEGICSCSVRVSVQISRQQIPEEYPVELDFEEDKQFCQIRDDACRVALDSYSFLLTRDYMFIAPRIREDGFNSISFSGFAFAKTEQEAGRIEHAGLYQLLRLTMRPIRE